MNAEKTSASKPNHRHQTVANGAAVGAAGMAGSVSNGFQRCPGRGRADANGCNRGSGPQESVTVRVEVFGSVVAHEVVSYARDCDWTRWTDAARTTAGTLLGGPTRMVPGTITALSGATSRSYAHL